MRNDEKLIALVKEMFDRGLSAKGISAKLLGEHKIEKSREAIGGILSRKKWIRPPEAEIVHSQYMVNVSRAQGARLAKLKNAVAARAAPHKVLVTSMFSGEIPSGHQCHYASGDPATYCGRQAEPGHKTHYCTEHRRLMYQPSKQSTRPYIPGLKI